MAARALQALFHVDPFDLGPEEGTEEEREDFEARVSSFEARQDMARVGAMLLNELASNSRSLLQKPMVVQFVAGGGPKVEPYRVGDAGGEGPDEGPVE